MTIPDNRFLLVCRIECPTQMMEGVDTWMPKHFDDSLDHKGVTSVASYRNIRDFDNNTGLPWIFNGHGNRFIVYVIDTFEDVLDWLDGPIIREAIKDGVDRESSFPALDGEPFTGNIYEVRKVVRPVGQDFSGSSSVFVERFEVGSDRESEFVDWLEGKHLAALSSISEVIRVRTFHQRRDVPQRFPYDRYCSKGNYMIMADLPGETDMRAFVKNRQMRELLADSVRWDTLLPYVTREVSVNFALRNQQDAKETFAERRSSSNGQ